MRLRGIYAPMTTPFDHRGSIYWSKFDYNLAQLRRTRLSGIVVTDRWGEAPLLSSGEKASIWKRSVEGGEGGFEVLASISESGVSIAREAVAAAADAGCSAAILETPDLAALDPGADLASLFFRAVADSAQLPVLVSVRLGSPGGIAPETLAVLAMHPRIVGAVVEHTPAQAIVAAARKCGRNFPVAVRDLACAPTCLAAGAAAAIPAIAAAVPFYTLSIEEAVRTRDHAAAKALTERAIDFAGLVEAQGVPALKHALDLQSYYGGTPRLPLLGVRPETAKAISLSLHELAS